MCDADAYLVVGVWLRCTMDLCSTPCSVIQGALVAKRFILGDLDNSTNAFQWFSVLNNLPCSSTYNMSEPKIKKWRLDGMTASEIVQYMDDLRLIAATKRSA